VARAIAGVGAATAAVTMTGTAAKAATLVGAAAIRSADTRWSPFEMDAGQTMRDGAYRLDMQSDCNLVLYKGDTALWSTGTAGKAPAWSCRMILQDDAHLVVYSGGQGETGRVVWASDRYVPYHDELFRLTLQDDGNVVVYDTTGAVIWSTNTAGR
jgi:hypothetical protein